MRFKGSDFDIAEGTRARLVGERGETNHQFLQVTLRTFSQGENAPFHFPRLALVRISFISLRRPRLTRHCCRVRESGFFSTRNGISICGLQGIGHDQSNQTLLILESTPIWSLNHFYSSVIHSTEFPLFIDDRPLSAYLPVHVPNEANKPQIFSFCSIVLKFFCGLRCSVPGLIK